MILRRFMQHIKEQNWFAVGLDVIVVIVGIFLGMQFTEWHESRENEKQEILLLERILKDLSYTKQEFTELKEIVEQWNSDAKTALLALQNTSLPFPDNAADSFTRSLQITASKPQIISIEEAVSSGQMKLIRSQELRTAITKLVYSLDSSWQSRDNLVNYINPLIPEIQFKVRRTFDENGEMIRSVDYDKLSQDESFQNAVGYALRALGANAIWFAESIRDIEQLEVIIKNELDNLS